MSSFACHEYSLDTEAQLFFPIQEESNANDDAPVFRGEMADLPIEPTLQQKTKPIIWQCQLIQGDFRFEFQTTNYWKLTVFLENPWTLATYEDLYTDKITGKDFSIRVIMEEETPSFGRSVV